METVAWVGAIETAIAILYIALVGQRSIAQWLDDRRRKKQPTAETEPNTDVKPPDKGTAKPLPRARRRLFSIQSIGDYIEYLWDDPKEAGLITAKALAISAGLIFGTATLLLVLGALVLWVVAGIAQNGTIGNVGGILFAVGLGTAFIAFFAIAAFYAISEELDHFMYIQLLAQRMLESEREQAETKARPQRRRTTSK